MYWWIIVGAAGLAIAYGVRLLWRRRSRQHDQDVNRRIDERLDGLDFRRRQKD